MKINYSLPIMFSFFFALMLHPHSGKGKINAYTKVSIPPKKDLIESLKKINAYQPIVEDTAILDTICNKNIPFDEIEISISHFADRYWCEKFEPKYSSEKFKSLKEIIKQVRNDYNATISTLIKNIKKIVYPKK